jgi:hypothetical protein
MDNTRIILAGFWMTLMLTYLLGDVLRIFAGDLEQGTISGVEVNQWMWMLIAVIMLIPIAMVMLSLTLKYPAVRWVTIGVAVFQIIFNIAGLPYKGMYDNFLIGVSFVIDALIIWQAWKWVV